MTDDNSRLFDRVVNEMYQAADGNITETDDDGVREPPTVRFTVDQRGGSQDAIAVAHEYGGEVIGVTPDGEVCVYFSWAN